MFCLLNAFGAIRTDRNHLGANRFLNLFLLEFNHSGQLSSLLLQVIHSKNPLISIHIPSKSLFLPFKVNPIRSNTFILSTSIDIKLPHLLLSNLRRQSISTQRVTSNRRRYHNQLTFIQLDMVAFAKQR